MWPVFFPLWLSSIFFSNTGFEQCNYVMTCCGFLHDSYPWSSLNLLKLSVYGFITFGKMLTIVLQIFFCHPLGDANYIYSITWSCPTVHWCSIQFQLFFFLSVISLGSSFCYVFMFSNLSLYLVFFNSYNMFHLFLYFLFVFISNTVNIMNVWTTHTFINSFI